MDGSRLKRLGRIEYKLAAFVFQRPCFGEDFIGDAVRRSCAPSYRGRVTHFWRETARRRGSLQ